MKDWRGKTLAEGDKVVYTVRHGSLMQVNEGEITELGLSPDGTEMVRVRWLRNNKQYSMRTQNRRYDEVSVMLRNITKLET